MHDFEVELLRLLIEMGRRIVEWTLNSLSPERHLMPGELFYQNDHYRLKGLSPTRNLNCLFGKIRVWRWLYEGTEGLGLPALFPLQMELGILAGVATPALADRVGQLAAELTQRQCLDVLRQQHHVVWGTETLRKVTAGMAEAMSPFRHQVQVDQVLAWLKQAAAEGGPRKILLSVGRDGVMLPIRSFKKYREGAAATVSVFNRHGKRLGTVYLGQMPELRPMVDYVELSTPASTDYFVRPVAGSIYGLLPTPARFKSPWLRPRSPIRTGSAGRGTLASHQHRACVWCW